MRLAATLALVAGILVSGLVPVALAREASPARVVPCCTRVDFNVEITSARNMTCRQAARDLRRHRGSIGARFRTPRGVLVPSRLRELPRRPMAVRQENTGLPLRVQRLSARRGARRLVNRGEARRGRSG